jgi:hypothetical protein
VAGPDRGEQEHAGSRRKRHESKKWRCRVVSRIFILAMSEKRRHRVFDRWLDANGAARHNQGGDPLRFARMQLTFGSQVVDASAELP